MGKMGSICLYDSLSGADSERLNYLTSQIYKEKKSGKIYSGRILIVRVCYGKSGNVNGAL